YGSNPVSTPPRTFTVVASAVPTITSIKDATGKEIANGASVVTATVTLTGTASRGQQVEIRDGTTVMRTVAANSSGAWTTPALPVTAKAYSITARGLYGSNPVSTPPRTFTVVASAVPTITSIKDATGKEIANGASVVTTTVTLTGTASHGQQVEIRDGTTVMRTVTANSSGAWTTPALPVTTKTYSITARGVYGSNPVSTPPRTFTVRPNLVQPEITAVYDNRMVYCPNGGSSGAWFFGDIQGTASTGQRISVFINGSGYVIPVGENNRWSFGRWNDSGGVNATYTVIVQYEHYPDMQSQPYTVRNA
ncbi:hypothetical protein ACW9HU_24805, partial [Pseudomonas agarici]